MRRPLLLAVTAVAVAFACTSDRPTTGPARRLSAAISDGHSQQAGGNPHFFFLPPILPPASNGTFNPNLSPVVLICALAVASDCDPNTGFSPGAVQVDPILQQYQVNWNTDPLSVVVGTIYRVNVLVGKQRLGFADVQPISNASMKSLVSGDVIALVDGRVLPIKFRIEGQALCFGATDCVEATVGTVAQDVIAPSFRAAVHFDPGSFSQNVELVLQKVVTDGKTVVCHNSDLQQFDDCYDISVTPNVPLNAGHLARVEICLAMDPTSPDAVEKDPLLVKSEPGVPGVIELAEAPHSLIVCPGYPSISPPSVTGGRSVGRLMDLASAGWRLVRGLFEARPLQAASLVIDEGLGGSTGSFSHFGWVIPRVFSISAGNGQTAVVGAILPVNPKVCLVNTHPLTTPVFGATVSFTITGGGGHFIVGETAVDFATVSTGVTGCAAIPWQLGLVAGTNTMMASVTFAAQRTQTFTATGIVPATLLVRPSSQGVTVGPGASLPLTQPSGLSMQSGTGIQLEVSPPIGVTWSSSDPTGTTASVNTTGLVAVVQGNVDPTTAHEVTFTASGSGASGTIKLNSFTFDHFPRLTTLVWRPVVGAASYDVIVEAGNGASTPDCGATPADCATWFQLFSQRTTDLRLAFGFVGKQPGRWHVVARDASGIVIIESELVYFRYIN